jgi:hypothetical protein
MRRGVRASANVDIVAHLTRRWARWRGTSANPAAELGASGPLAIGPRHYADLLETFAAIGTGSLVLADAAARAQVEGDAEVAQRCLRLLAPAAMDAQAGVA